MVMHQSKATGGACWPGHRARQGLGLVAACAVLACLGRLSAAADGDKPAAKQGAASAPPRTDLYGDRLPDGARARLGTLRWRHGAAVSYVAFTPDGKSVLTASQDNVIRLWDLKTGKEIRRYEARQAGKPNFAAPPGGMMAPGWGRMSIGLVSVALAPDGKTLAATTLHNSVQLWDVATGKALRSLAPGHGTSALLFSPDGVLLAGRGADQAVRLWEVSTGKEVRQIRRVQNQPGRGVVVVGGFFGAGSLAFSPDGKLLAAPETVFDNGQVKTSVTLWEVATGKELRQIEAGMGGGVPVLALAPDGKALAYASINGIHLCSVETGKEIRQVGPQRFGTTALVFSPDGKTLAGSSTTDRRIQLYSVATGKVVRELGDGNAAQAVNQPFVMAFGGAAAGGLTFSPDGKLVAAGTGGTVCFWAADTGKEAAQVSGHRGEITSLVMAPGGKLVASGAADDTVRLWDADSGKERHQFAAPHGTCAAFAPDARRVALGTASGSVLLRDTATGKELHRLQGHQQGVGAVAFSPDGKTVASRGTMDDSIRLYETATGRKLRMIGPPPPKNAGGAGQVFMMMGPGAGRLGLAFSPDGRLIASPRANTGNAPGGFAPGGMPMQTTLHLWRVSTGKEVQKIVLPPQYSLVSFAFAPDGRVLATENADQTITLWEVASGKERARLGKPPAVQPPPGGAVMMLGVGGRFGRFGLAAASPTIAFAPDGRTLAAASQDQSVHLWDIATGKVVSALRGHEGSVTALAFAPDGKTLASGSSDTTVLIWDAAGLNPAAKPVAVQLPAAEVAAVWTDLASPDGVKAYQGMQKLRTAPGQVVPMLRERLRPAVPIEAAKVRELVADLGSKRFTLRQRASTALEKLGELAVPELTRTLRSGPPLETRMRIEQLLDKVTGGSLSNEQLRLVRAVEVLEMLDDPEARQVLQTLSRGAPGALPTREAQAALDRLARRPSTQP
jgi:WD40 repeat protein